MMTQQRLSKEWAPPLTAAPNFPSIFWRSFSVVIINNDLFQSSHSGNSSLISNMVLPLHRRIKLFTANRGALSAPFYPGASPQSEGSGVVCAGSVTQKDFCIKMFSPLSGEELVGLFWISPRMNIICTSSDEPYYTENTN